MARSDIDWGQVKRILVVRLRSIGDTVLSTPSLIALRRFIPNAEIDILLEDWVAPLLDGFEGVRVITVGDRNSAKLKTANYLLGRRYDIAINLHGGTTSSFLTKATRAKHRIGLSHYRYKRFYNHLYSSAADFWHRDILHSAEQQLAVLGFAGVPVDDCPKSHLAVTQDAIERLDRRLADCASRTTYSALALVHPTAAFATKQWSNVNFARTSEFLAEKGLNVIAVAAKHESKVLRDLKSLTKIPITTFDDLSLPEITALASRSSVFVGNDSGIAHIAAAVGTPTVVVFGSSNRNHWRPWTDAPNEIVFEPFACQPCPGRICAEFGEPKCILNVTPSAVFTALERVLAAAKI
ncbi:MAG: glycosyltransferase family 9 protein [Pyrinomonadaceae bacterium]|nr:glycosyltransferase family 9 protein [Acidobacteriota bacterium]MBK7933005.1 glycosyltransferase family 9 protein [Acidobacteriota bacterium]MBP7376495.1 glycosyltransferase family 9 protein [Pyrinomonadaceae bacterium]